MTRILDFLLHFDRSLTMIVGEYGVLTYGILFAVIFVETGFIIVPFLPGDSLLFTAGTIGALGALNIWILAPLLTIAAVAGDSVNYAIGRRLGEVALRRGKLLGIPIKQSHIARAEEFYNRYGGKAIVLARFIPIVRSVIPFVAGVGRMRYTLFLTYNILGAIIWVFGFILLGYLFGNLPFVRDNYSLAILGIIAVSFLPTIFEVIRSRRKK